VQESTKPSNSQQQHDDPTSRACVSQASILLQVFVSSCVCVCLCVCVCVCVCARERESACVCGGGCLACLLECVRGAVGGRDHHVIITSSELFLCVQDKKAATRCSYEECQAKLDDSVKSYVVTELFGARGRDWRQLKGQTLCKNCYSRFARNGTLEYKKRGVEINSRKRCENPNCNKLLTTERTPRHISSTTTAGGQDWSALIDKTLCNACYCNFMASGTLREREPQGKGKSHAH
jgi:hypothetical protein